VTKSSFLSLLSIFFSGRFFCNKEGKILFKNLEKMTGLQHPSRGGPKIHVLPNQTSNFLTSLMLNPSLHNPWLGGGGGGGRRLPL